MPAKSWSRRAAAASAVLALALGTVALAQTTPEVPTATPPAGVPADATAPAPATDLNLRPSVDATAPATPPPAPTETPPAKAESFTRPAPALPDGPVGVQECDDYITKYLACLPKMQRPEVAETITRAVMDSKKAWRSVAQTEENKLALKEACVQATNAAKQALAQYNCQW